MCGAIEFGKCDICGKKAQLERTYFEYAISCDCCGAKHEGKPVHFELVHHCSECIPSLPTEIHPYIKAMDGKSYRAIVKNVLPINISGQFNITQAVITEDITLKTH
jgi:hypothetical protein